MFDLTALTDRQRAIIDRALARCDFDWTRLAEGLRRNAGKESMPVDFQDLSRYGARVRGLDTHLPYGHLIASRDRVLGLAWYSGRVTLDSSLEEEPELAGEVFLSEGAHMVDFFLFDQEDRVLIDSVMHPYGVDEHEWFDNPSYWDDIGETWMGLFVLGYSDFAMTLTGFTHVPAVAAASAIRTHIEERYGEEVPDESELPPADDDGDILVPPVPPEERDGFLVALVRFLRDLVRWLLGSY